MATINVNVDDKIKEQAYLLEASLAVVAAIVGIVWLVRMVRYFRTFMNDEPFLSALSAKYDAEIVPNKPLWVKRHTLSFCLFSTAALIFLTCVRLSIGNITNGDGVLLFTLEAFYAVPEFLFGIMMIFAFRRVREYYAEWREGVKKSTLFAVVAFAAYVVQFIIAATYGRMFRPYKEVGYCVLFAVSILLFALSMMLFIRICAEKEKVYSCLVNEIGLVLSPDDHEYACKRREHLAADFRGKIHGLYIFGVIYAIFSIVCMAIVPFGEEYVICGISWLFRSAACVFLIVQSVLLTDKLQNEIEKVVD